MLTKAVREALEAELALCRAHIVKYEAKAQALEAVLAPDDQLGFFDSPPVITIQSNDTAQAANLNRMPGTNGSVAAMGWREAIFYVLRKYPSGLTARDVAEKVEGAGKKSTGKISTAVMISSEMSRMKSHGLLQKEGNKYLPPA